MAGSDSPEPSAGTETWSPCKVYPESTFFQESRAAALPSPAEIRALNDATGHYRAKSSNRPPPVIIPSLGLAVKYGTDVTAAEAETQVMLHERLRDQVPIPEVFGWTEDEGQRFIYMSLIEGDTLQTRFGKMDEGERQAVCNELKHMVNAWRALSQDETDTYIGSVGKEPLNDIFVASQPGRSGPFVGTDAVRQFHDACGIDIDEELPISFTHNDLCPPNIIISNGPNPRVVGIIDWGQSGWFPSYWEYCKARRVGVVDQEFTSEICEEWQTRYLPQVIDPVDDETFYHPWLYFMLSNI